MLGYIVLSCILLVATVPTDVYSVMVKIWRGTESGQYPSQTQTNPIAKKIAYKMTAPEPEL